MTQPFYIAAFARDGEKGGVGLPGKLELAAQECALDIRDGKLDFLLYSDGLRPSELGVPSDCWCRLVEFTTCSLMWANW